MDTSVSDKAVNEASQSAEKVCRYFGLLLRLVPVLGIGIPVNPDHAHTGIVAPVETNQGRWHVFNARQDVLQGMEFSGVDPLGDGFFAVAKVLPCNRR